MKLSLINFHELNWIQPLTELILIKFIIIHEILSWTHEQATNWIDPNKFIKTHDSSWNSPNEILELNHEQH